MMVRFLSIEKPPVGGRFWEKGEHFDFASNDYVKKLHFSYMSKCYIISHKAFWIHQYLYFYKINRRIVGTYQWNRVSFSN